MTVKKLLDDFDHEAVKVSDLIKKGDWVLKWDPNAHSGSSGFYLFTPDNFDYEEGGAPLGGMVLAAVFFLLDNADESFAKDLITTANDMAAEVKRRNDQQGSMKPSSGRTLN